LFKRNGPALRQLAKRNGQSAFDLVRKFFVSPSNLDASDMKTSRQGQVDVFHMDVAWCGTTRLTRLPNYVQGAMTKSEVVIFCQEANRDRGQLSLAADAVCLV